MSSKCINNIIHQKSCQNIILINNLNSCSYVSMIRKATYSIMMGSYEGPRNNDLDGLKMQNVWLKIGYGWVMTYDMVPSVQPSYLPYFDIIINDIFLYEKSVF